jgi:hypothetical protein
MSPRTVSPRRTLLATVAVVTLAGVLLVGCDDGASSTSTPAPTSTQGTAAAQTTASAPERAQQPAFKGMELYSWQDATGEWKYSIEVGTNMVKDPVLVKSRPMTLDEVKVAISKLAVGEWLTWMGFIPPPPEDIMEELRRCASLYQVNFQTVLDD